MRKITPVIALIFVLGLLLNTLQSQSKTISHPVLVKGSHHYTPTPYNYSFGINVFNDFFSFSFFQEDICRKPVTADLLYPVGFSFKNYIFNGFTTYKTSRIGAHYQKVDGYSTYKKGNSTMLIPQSYIQPDHFYYIEEPGMILHKAD